LTPKTDADWRVVHGCSASHASNTRYC
jgi:hypothetical protein